MVACEQTAPGSSGRTGRGRTFQLQPWTEPHSQRGTAGNDHRRGQTRGTGDEISLPCSHLVAPLAEPGGPELSRYPKVCHLEQGRSSAGAELCLICEVSTSTWPSAGSGHSSISLGHLAPPAWPCSPSPSFPLFPQHLSQLLAHIPGWSFHCQTRLGVVFGKSVCLR